MAAPNELRVVFRMNGENDLDPEEVVRASNITPGAIWKKGDKKDPRVALTHKTNGLRIESNLPSWAPFEEQLESF